MDLASLEIFCAVARTGGITRAAAQLHRVQSNVTTRIQQLETSLGMPLFMRENKRLSLSPAGQRLLPYAERLLALAVEARSALDDGPPSGLFRLGALESTAASRLPPLLAAFHARWPDVRLELTTAPTDPLVEDVRAARLDAALVAGSVDMQVFDGVPVFDETLVWVAPAGRGPVRHAADVDGLTLLSFRAGCAYRRHAEAWYARHGASAPRMLELASYHTILACVAAGSGVALMPRSVVELHAVPGLSVAPLENGDIPTWLIWRRGTQLPALRAVRETLVPPL